VQHYVQSDLQHDYLGSLPGLFDDFFSIETMASGNRLIGKDLQGSGRGLFEVLS
jgi:hypothetical protein